MPIFRNMPPKMLLLVSILFVLFSFHLTSHSVFATTDDITNAWNIDKNMPFKNANHVSFNIADNLVVITGSAVTYASHNDSIFAKPDILGILDGWYPTTNYPVAMLWGSRASNQNFKYILGGYEEYSSSNKYSNNLVYKTNNSLPLNWLEQTPLVGALSGAAAVVAKDYIYISGGWKDSRDLSHTSNNVYYASVDPNTGEIGSWNPTTPLPYDHGVFDHALFEGGGYLFNVGGFDPSINRSVSNVYKAKINFDGTIGDWIPAPSLPEANFNFYSNQVEDYAFVAGGRYDLAQNDTGKYKDVYYTTIDELGNMSPWEKSTNSLPQNMWGGSMSSVNGYLYITGGMTETSSAGYTDRVYKSKLNFPFYISLPVPNLKQYEGGWENLIYDHTNKTIKDWGCALTSASMVLQYYGFDWVNPDNLNEWLNSQPDGYIRNGLLNWLAISRYSYTQKLSDEPSLEYFRTNNPTDGNILSELENNRPGIVKVPGHFVVSKGQTDNSFEINDPAHSDRLTLDEYSNNLALNIFVPSNTDLSYMMFVGSTYLDFELVDENGTTIITQNFTETPIKEDGETVSVLLFPKPENGQYKLKVSTSVPGEFLLDAYLYDTKGNVVTKSFDGIFINNEIYTYDINFDNSLNEISRKGDGVYKSIARKLLNSDKLDEVQIQNLIEQAENLTPKILTKEFLEMVHQILDK